MNELNFYAPFCLPFIVGAAIMFAILLYRYASWLYSLPRKDIMLILHGVFSAATLKSVWEVVRESLLHFRIWRTNPVLGYMHTSLAAGWFMLIAVGWAEVVAYLGTRYVPLQGHVFFRYFASDIPYHLRFFDQTMDALLLVVLSGVALAWLKRLRSRTMGMRRTTRHTAGDRMALSFLWFVFPLRLAAESITAAIYGGGGFMTGSIGELLSWAVNYEVLRALLEPLWWAYSISLGCFFLAMPFSRYMHIFTEIPLIFLRNYRLHPYDKESSVDNFEIQACSRCGICIDPCQLQSVLGHDDVQSVYFLRDRRENMLKLATASDCLMCGRCQSVCPVGINLNTLRQNSRDTMRNIPDERRYDYLRGIDPSSGEGKVGYFAGCMTSLTPRTLSAMATIFKAAGEQAWWADRDGGICCGRPLKLSGETDSARKMMEQNTALFYKHRITTLVTSCPICLKVFREDYNLHGIEVLHHTEYIDRLIRLGRLHLSPTEQSFTYHDPCELGRGCGVYDAPREILAALGELREPAHNRRNSLCCGASLANTVINDTEQQQLAQNMTDELRATAADTIVTACPLCKKAIARQSGSTPVRDISEIVADNIAQ